MTKDNIVSVTWLAEQIGRDDLVVADCRFDLTDPEAGRRAYEEGHIPGAMYFDLDKDLSRPARGKGGRHPLPPLDDFVALLQSRGVTDDTAVVCYDDSGGGMAGRLWWMLRYIGHQDTVLLDGGFSAWIEAGLPVRAAASATTTESLGAEAIAPADPTERTSAVSTRPGRGGRLTVRRQHHMVATVDDVRAVSGGGGGVIVDSRAPERYRGDVEPLDPVAGHIPGAVNYPWEGNLDGQGRFLPVEALAARFAPLTSSGRDVIVHCGSGVTGCVNVLALDQVGIQNVKLYVGGWSDWCADPDNPVETGDPRRAAGRGPSGTLSGPTQ